MAQFGVVSFVPLSGPCSTNTLGFDTTNNVVYSCGSPPQNYWKVVTFETVNAGPLSGTCNPNSLGFDTTNNVVYSCGTAPNNTWQKLGGGGGPGGITGAVQGEPVYGTGTNTASSVITELAVDTFAGADFGTKANAAIAALPSTGGTIRFSCANYAASNTTITISVNNVTLQGCGSQNASVFATGGTTLNFAAGVSGIVSTGANTQIRDLMVASADTSTGTDNGISLGQQKPILWNVGVRKFGASGIIFNNNTDRWNMTNVESSGNYGDGYRFTAVADDNLGIGQNLSAVSNGGIGYDILGGGSNVFQTTHAANNAGGAWFVHAVDNFFLNTYIETGTGSSFIFDTGINGNTVTFTDFGFPATYTDGGTNVKQRNGYNDALSLARSVMATSVSGTDTITLATFPKFAKQTQPGLEVNFVPVGSNTTTSVTAAVNGMTALPVQKSSPSGLVNLAVGDLVTSTVASLSLDPSASFWVLGNPATSSFVGGVPGILGDLLFSSGVNTLDVDSGNAYYDLSNKIFYVPSMRLNSATDGYVSYVAGTGTLPALAANSTGFSAPVSGGTSGLIKLPNTLTAGAFTTAAPTTINGVNQSQASITPVATTSTPNALVKTNSTGLIDPTFLTTASAAAMIITENFCGGGTSTGIIGALGWQLQSIGSTSTAAGVPGTWPYLCQLKFSTAAGATQGTGGSLNPGTGVNGQNWADFGTNTNWSLTYVFQLGSAASDVFYVGLGAGYSAFRQTNAIMLRHDANSPGSAAAITSVVCTTTQCTVTLTSVAPLLVGQTWTISGETCPTRNVNVANVAVSLAANIYRFNQSGAAETCTVQGTATSTAETTFKYTALNGTNQTVVDSGITADTNWHKINIASSVAGTVVFTLDANSPVSISTNVPTAAMLPIITLGTDATAQKFVTLNFFNFTMTGLTR